MSKGQGGARQPLSRVRPGKAATKRSPAKPAKLAGPAKPAASAGAKRTTRVAAGGPPHRENAAAASNRRGRSVARASTATPTGAAAPAGDPLTLYDRLAARYPDARCALDHRNAYELLAATILSAQCTDKRVNMVTPALFAAYPTPAALAAARQEDVEEIIRSTGFFRNKAKSLVAMASALVDLHGGDVPADMAKLVELPGVGRKTANVILGNAFAMNEGVVVDTHVARVSRRLGLTRDDDPVKIESSLMPLFPRDRWTMLAHLLIEHGRQTCDAKRPRCGECVLRDLCPSAQ